MITYLFYRILRTNTLTFYTVNYLIHKHRIGHKHNMSEQNLRFLRRSILFQSMRHLFGLSLSDIQNSHEVIHFSFTIRNTFLYNFHILFSDYFCSSDTDTLGSSYAINFHYKPLLTLTHQNLNLSNSLKLPKPHSHPCRHMLS